MPENDESLQVPANRVPESSGVSLPDKIEPRWRQVARQQYTTNEKNQLSILDMMVVTGICGLAIAAIRHLQFLGATLLFVVCVCATVALTYRLQRPANMRFWNQFIWGILMPLGCIFADPFVFGSFDKGEAQFLNKFALASYIFVGLQMLFLIASWFVTQKQKRVKQILGGGMLAGALFAAIVGLMILPFTLMGILLFFAGIVGVTPWLTALVYYRTGVMLLRQSSLESQSPISWILVCGSLISMLALWFVFFQLTNLGWFTY